MLRLMIIYVWFGAMVPEDYLLQFTETNYPARILLNPINNLPYKRDIMKADRYRLEVLKNGGLYSDFDNRINYDCLMKRVTNFHGQLMAMYFPGKQWQGSVANGFLYVPPQNTSLIRQILEKEGKNCTDRKGVENNQVSCHSNYRIGRYRKRISVQNLDECIVHTFDWSWWKESGVNITTTSPHKKFATKLTKKKDFKQIIEGLEQQLADDNKILEALQVKYSDLQKKQSDFIAKIARQEEVKIKLAELQKEVEKILETNSKEELEATATSEQIERKLKDLEQNHFEKQKELNLLEKQIIEGAKKVQQNKELTKKRYGQLQRHFMEFKNQKLVIWIALCIILFSLVPLIVILHLKMKSLESRTKAMYQSIAKESLSAK